MNVSCYSLGGFSDMPSQHILCWTKAKLQATFLKLQLFKNQIEEEEEEEEEEEKKIFHAFSYFAHLANL